MVITEMVFVGSNNQGILLYDDAADISIYFPMNLVWSVDQFYIYPNFTYQSTITQGNDADGNPVTDAVYTFTMGQLTATVIHSDLNSFFGGPPAGAEADTTKLNNYLYQ